MLYLHLHHYVTHTWNAGETDGKRPECVSASEDLPRAETLYPTENPCFLQTTKLVSLPVTELSSLLGN